MKECTNALLGHKTIRKFKKEPLSKEVVEHLLAVANHTATSMGMQMASIVRITDPDKKSTLASIGNQPYMADATELWIFIVDLWRNMEIAKAYAQEKGLSIEDFSSYVNMDKFFQGFTDACLMAQNVVSAAEISGYGTNYFGNIHNDLQRVIELLELPLYTLPVVGLGIGVPDQEPQLKPRLSVTSRVFENTYPQEIDKTALAFYDEIIQSYYDLREGGRPQESFSKQVFEKQGVSILKRNDILQVMKHQGFHVE